MNDRNFIHKPVLALRKVDEGETVNPRTYWTLTVRTMDHTYELRVSYGRPTEQFAFYRWSDGEARRLVTVEEYREWREAIVENEGNGPCMVQGCANPDGAAYRVNDDGPGFTGAVRLCKDCDRRSDVWTVKLTEADALNRADAILAVKGVETVHESEVPVRRRLMGYWDAVALLVSPEVNTFTNGWQEVR